MRITIWDLSRKVNHLSEVICDRKIHDLSHDLYFPILVEVFTKYILAENILHESKTVNKTQDHGLKTRK